MPEGRASTCALPPLLLLPDQALSLRPGRFGCCDTLYIGALSGHAVGYSAPVPSSSRIKRLLSDKVHAGTSRPARSRPRCPLFSILRISRQRLALSRTVAPSLAPSDFARPVPNGLIGCCDTTRVVPPVATTAASPNLLTRVGVVRSPTPTFSRDLHSPHQDAFHVRPTAALSSSSVALPDATAGCSSGWLLGGTHNSAAPATRSHSAARLLSAS